MVKELSNHTLRFVDKADKSTLETTIAVDGQGVLFDIAHGKTGDGAVVLVNTLDLIVLRRQIDRALGQEKTTEEVGIEPDPEAERSEKDKLADDITSILDLFRENPLTTKGDFLLFDGNAYRVMEGLKNVLEGRNV